MTGEYKHYGNIGDVWKHLPLAATLEMEQPQHYIESNAAAAVHRLEGTARQQYGVYTFFRGASRIDELRRSRYYKLLEASNPEGELRRYLGSPALALTVLRERSTQFLFFDIDPTALKDIGSFAHTLGMRHRIRVQNEDSLLALSQLIPTLDRSAFIHFDPYDIFEPNARGQTVFDLFLEASNHGIRSLLWYCYFTRRERDRMYRTMRAAIIERDARLAAPLAYGVRQREIAQRREELHKKTNPGVVGCGVILGNCDRETHRVVARLRDTLIALYHGAQYDGRPAELRHETVELYPGQMGR